MLHGTNPFSPTVQAWLANLLSFARILIPILFLGLGCGGPGACLDGGFAQRLGFAPILEYSLLWGFRSLSSFWGWAFGALPADSTLTRFWPAFARRLAFAPDFALWRLTRTWACGDLAPV